MDWQISATHMNCTEMTLQDLLYKDGLKQTKGFTLGLSARRMKDLVKLNRDQLRWTI
jgi:hypothetical protein